MRKTKAIKALLKLREITLSGYRYDNYMEIPVGETVPLFVALDQFYGAIDRQLHDEGYKETK